MNKNQPTLFIGSSKESKKYVEAIENELYHDDFNVVPWYRLFDEPLKVTLDHLEKLKSFDFGILVLTPDDIVQYRNEEIESPRDNLIFELGLMIGFIGRNRVFPIIPLDKPLKLPTDLLGTNPLPVKYSNEYKDIKDYQQAVSYACNHIRNNINNIGKNPPKYGETLTDYRSGIRLNDILLFNPEKNYLVYQIAYNGIGNLLDVKINASFNEIFFNKKSKRFKSTQYTVKIGTNYQPELKVAFESYHKLDYSSPIVNSIFPNLKLSNEFEINLEALNNISGCINIFVQGFDSVNMTKHFYKKLFKPCDIKIANFKKFYKIDENGEIELDKVNWDDFNKIEYDKKNI
jgi:hypothetical protein